MGGRGPGPEVSSPGAGAELQLQKAPPSLPYLTSPRPCGRLTKRPTLWPWGLVGGGSRPGSEASPVLGAKRKDQGDPWRPLRCGPAVAGGGGDRGISSSSQSRVTESVEILGIASCHSYAQLAGGPWRPPVLDTKPSSGDSGWGRSPEGCGGPQLLLEGLFRTETRWPGDPA